MERLQREQDGHCRTPSGFCAVILKTSSGVTPDQKSKFFEFKASMLSEVVRVEWPATSPVALIENDIAITLVGIGYAVDLTNEQLNEYNSLVDSCNGKAVFPPAGWTQHPSAAGYYYKGNEVLTEADLRARGE